jgi:hypothetical protein
MQQATVRVLPSGENVVEHSSPDGADRGQAPTPIIGEPNPRDAPVTAIGPSRDVTEPLKLVQLATDRGLINL